MIRLLQHIILFLVQFAVVCFTLILIVASSTAFTGKLEEVTLVNATEVGQNYQRTKDLDQWLGSISKDKTCLMLGGSTIFSNINPNMLTEQTGIDFFCAASNSQSFVNSQYILEYAVSKGKKIDYVLLSADQMLWELKSKECTTDWIVNNHNPMHKYVFDMTTQSSSYTLWIYYAYFSVKRLLPWSKEYISKDALDNKYIGRGAACYDDATPQKQIDATIPHKELTEANKKAFKNIRSLCSNNHIKIILLIPRFLKVEHQPIPFTAQGDILIDTSPIIPDSNDYYDNYHLRCRGTEKYTLWIADELKRQLN